MYTLLFIVDCVWNHWSNWTVCNVTCAGGQQKRSRTKNEEKYGGEPCPGPHDEWQSCNPHPCPGKYLEMNKI